MATVFSGERLLELKRINDTSVPTVGTYIFYTVPANRWARVEIEYIKIISPTNFLDSSRLKFGVTVWDELARWRANNGAPSGVYGDKWQRSGNTEAQGVGAIGTAGKLDFILLSGETIEEFVGSSAQQGYLLIATVREYANP